MDAGINYIKANGITDKFDIIRVLMEHAEKLSQDGPTKKRLVMEAYVKLNNMDSQVQKTYSMIPLNSIELIIDALVYASQTVIAINKKTGCFAKIKGLFKKKSSASTTV